MTTHSIKSLTHWSASVLESCQVPPEEALQAAHLLVRSDLRGYTTHGMTRLPSYVERLLANDFNPRAQLRHREFPGGIVLDADGAMGQIAGGLAIRLALQALERSASVLVAVQSCGHMGALGVYALRPGITGLAQVQGIDMSDPGKLAEKDAEYLRDRTLGMDAKIMFWTVLGGQKSLP